MTMLAWLGAFVTVPLTFGLDTARAVNGNAVTLGIAVWLAAALLVAIRSDP